MKKLFSMILILALICPVCASAVTVSEFVERYNADIGEGEYNVYVNEMFISGEWWFVSGADSRHTVGVMFDTSAADPAQAEILSVTVRQTRRVSVSTFINNASAALAAVFPDVPEDIRLSELVRCLRVRDKVLGLYYTERQAVPYHSEYFGEMVYQEDQSYNTILFSPASDQ